MCSSCFDIFWFQESRFHYEYTNFNFSIFKKKYINNINCKTEALKQIVVLIEPQIRGVEIVSIVIHHWQYNFPKIQFVSMKRIHVHEPIKFLLKCPFDQINTSTSVLVVVGRKEYIYSQKLLFLLFHIICVDFIQLSLIRF